MSDVTPPSISDSSYPTSSAAEGAEPPKGPSKNELKKRAKEEEKARKAAEKAARQAELEAQKAAADVVRTLPQPRPRAHRPDTPPSLAGSPAAGLRDGVLRQAPAEPIAGSPAARARADRRP